MKRSRGKKRKIKPRILILCEGETERNYFQAMKEHEEFKQQLSAMNPHVLKARHTAPDQIIKEAQRRQNEETADGNPYEYIWVVFDHDLHPHRKKAYEEAVSQGFGIAFSAISFEFWFLLHYKKQPDLILMLAYY